MNDLGAASAKASEGSLTRSVAAAGDGVAENMHLKSAGQCRFGRGGHARACVQPSQDDVLNAMFAQKLLQGRVAERIALPFGDIDGTGCGESWIPARPWAASNRGASSHKVPNEVVRPELVSDLDNQVAASLGLNNGGLGGRHYRPDLISCDRHPSVIGKEVVLEVD
jgi:hypothetical protein